MVRAESSPRDRVRAVELAAVAGRYEGELRIALEHPELIGDVDVDQIAAGVAKGVLRGRDADIPGELVASLDRRRVGGLRHRDGALDRGGRGSHHLHVAQANVANAREVDGKQ